MRRKAGPFEILDILGEGSFGTVCIARITADPLRRKVALKILKGTYTRNQKVLNRTRDEARLLSKISHPNIVRVERLMQIGERPVVVMELVRGVSLDQLLLRFKEGLPTSVALAIIRQTSLALHVAYNEAQGDDGRPLRVIHRDIKPSNIMLSVRGEVKVMDFGIARGEFEGREAETESVVMGSRPYMAPERLDGISDSPSVDVYSTGMTMFELLTGRTMSLSINPLSHERAMTKQLGYLQARDLPPTALEDLRDIIRRMCAYDRDYRPSAIEVVRDLERIERAVDPDLSLTLEEFATTTVEPIYESRPPVAPEDAIQHSEDGEFLAEVTGHLTNTGRTGGGPIRNRVAMPTLLFLGGIASVVAVLGLAAALKLVLPRLHVDTGMAAGAIAETSGQVRVKVWFPDQATAELGSRILPTTGSAWIDPGEAELRVSFDDGQLVSCPFTAYAETALRVFEQGGTRGFTVNDGAFTPCEVIDG